ncbi:MAG: glycosyltransferase family 4 protein [Treponema sp.]|nr:glycosyltransferase family 4 protein [Treponema sp.]
MKKTTVYLASKNGILNAGGLERVNLYIYTLLSAYYPVEIVRKREKPFKHGDWLLQSLYISLKLFFKKNKFVIGTSWHSFLYPCNLTFHHGTTAGILYNKCEPVNLYKKRIAAMEKISAILAKKNIAVSENTKDELIKFYHIPESKITVLNNFVDDSVFVPKITQNHIPVHVIFAGRLETRKGLDKLIELSKYIESYSGFELYIATVTGTNNILFSNNKHTHVYTGIKFGDMPEFYQNGDILYFPTFYEGFSMATLEALSCGLPVIGSKYAVMPELQKYDFVQVTDSSDMKQLTENIQTLVNKNFLRKEEIHKIIKRDFGKEKYKEKLLSLIH